MVKGLVYLAGAGPGDAKLLTLRVAELLVKVDIVLYDLTIYDNKDMACLDDLQVMIPSVKRY